MDRFDKFSDRARKVLTQAQDEAQRFNHSYIGTEHLLLGLVREGEGVAARVLENMNVELPKVRTAVEFIIGRGDRPVVGEVGLTPRAKRVIELAIDEARRLGHNYIGTEHLLLGLVREGEGIAAGVLQSLGLNLDKVRREVIRVLSQGHTDDQERPREAHVKAAPTPLRPDDNRMGGGKLPGGKIYLRSDNGLIAMTEARYNAEEDLQLLLADYPDLLAGDQMRPGDPRRWLLVTREAGVPDADAGLPRWSLDHLFLDQDAIPTLVEVKRSSDTRIRREVVGQMLDYAANIVAHWPAGEIRRLFEDRCEATGDDAAAVVARFLGVPEGDDASAAVDDFWARAGSNLAARQLRLLFVADVIPPELQRVVEFLNRNLVRAEALAVEVKQYVGEGRQTLVTRVIGRTAAADEVKQAAPRTARVARNWTEAEFRQAAHDAGPLAEQLATHGLAWLARRHAPVILGHGKYGPLYLTLLDARGSQVTAFNVNTAGSVMIDYSGLAKFPPFDAVDVRLELKSAAQRDPECRHRRPLRDGSDLAVDQA